MQASRLFPYNIAFIGAGAAGKTQLVNRLSGKPFTEKYKPTIACDSELIIRKEERPYTFFNLNHLSGDERFNIDKKSRERIYQDTDVFILVFDCTNPKSFNELTTWYDEVKTYKVPIILVSNKCDLPATVQQSEWESFIRKNHITLFTRASAKENINCAELLYAIMQLAGAPKKKILASTFENKEPAHSSSNKWYSLLKPLFSINEYHELEPPSHEKPSP